MIQSYITILKEALEPIYKGLFCREIEAVLDADSSKKSLVDIYKLILSRKF